MCGFLKIRRKQKKICLRVDFELQIVFVENPGIFTIFQNIEISILSES